MLITVTGGSGSGKSEYAEKTALDLCGGKAPVYLATMAVWGDEGAKRVMRHRALRAGKGFQTLEKTRSLEEIPQDLLAGQTVLLEDLSNLISNELFTQNGMVPEETAIERIRRDLKHITDCAGNVVVVMNEVFSDGRKYDRGTETFLRLTGIMNRELALRADESYEIVYGIAVRLDNQPFPGENV